MSSCCCFVLFCFFSLPLILTLLSASISHFLMFFFLTKFISFVFYLANDIGDTRLLGLSEDQLYYHESVHTITQSCNHRFSDDYSQYNFHTLEPKEIVAAFSNLDSTKGTGNDLYHLRS